MLRLRLTCDLGNSRLKLRLWEPASDAPRGLLELPLASASELAHGLRRFLEAELAPDTELASALSSVADEARTEAVAACLASRGSLTSAPPIANTCRNPERVGADRLWAARGALDLLGASCIVLDAGTALTVDAARLDADGPAFLGGAIAPGPALLAEALERGGARLPAVRARPGAPALGRETAEALAAGVAVGFRGAARELLTRVAAEAGLGGAPVVLTGGARAFLLEPEPLVALRVEPELVHLGLRAALEV